MKISVDELLESIKGHGEDRQPLTVGLLKAILLDYKQRKERKQRRAVRLGKENGNNEKTRKPIGGL